jgi:signal transduction histidine kinase
MTMAFAASIAVLMLVVCGCLIRYARYSAERSADTLLNSTARKLQHELNGGEAHGDLSEILDEEGDLRAENLAVFVADAQGHVLRQSQRQIPSWPRTNDGWRVVTLKAGTKTVVIGLPWAKTEAALRSQAAVLGILCLFVVIAAAAGAWLLVGRTLSPIGLLSRQAQAASADSLRVHLSAPSQDSEIVGLVTTLNGLLARLSTTAAVRGRFYAAASHELRTPLQALSGHLEVALSRERDTEAYREALAEASRQTERLTSLVGDLLLLNQLDSAASLPPQETVCVADICERVVQHFQPLIRQRSLQIEMDLGPDLEILAPALHTEMLVRNLVENAVKYAAPEGKVTFQITSVSGTPRLEIFNECSPLPPEIARHLFEPFFRPDSSRNSATGGNGLGLAICKAIAAANGWTLSWIPEERGFKIAVLFREE